MKDFTIEFSPEMYTDDRVDPLILVVSGEDISIYLEDEIKEVISDFKQDEEWQTYELLDEIDRFLKSKGYTTKWVSPDTTIYL